MHGWDSYFIQVGLLRDGEVGTRAGHGGQLPLRDRALRHDPEREPHVLPEPLAAAVPDADDPRRLREARATTDWLRRRAATRSRSTTRSGRREPHLVPGPGLSRYYDLGEGPAPEVLSDERGRAGPQRTTTASASTTRPTRSPTTTSSRFYDARERPPRPPCSTRATARCASRASTRRTASGPSAWTSSTTRRSA